MRSPIWRRDVLKAGLTLEMVSTAWKVEVQHVKDWGPFMKSDYPTRNSLCAVFWNIASRKALPTALLIWHSVLSSSAATAAEEPYYVVNHYTGMVVDVWQGSKANTHTVLWTKNGQANQQFDLVYVDADRKYFQLKVRHAGKCLDVNNARADDGAMVQTFACHGGPSQLWYSKMVTDPYVKCRAGAFCDNSRMTIRAKHSGKCLDAGNPGPSLANRPKQGARLQQWSCLNNLNQFWDLAGGPALVLR
jgi:Ricin-type beta-trefoil lectin domain-like